MAALGLTSGWIYRAGQKSFSGTNTNTATKTEMNPRWIGGCQRKKYLSSQSQTLDEQTHTIKFDVSKNLDDWLLENNAQVQFYTEKNEGFESAILFGGTTPDQSIQTKDNYRQVHGMDTLMLEKQLWDWWFLSGGFYYSQLSGTDFLNKVTAIPSLGVNTILNSQQITL